MGPSVSETNPSYKLTHSLSPDQDTTFGLYVHQRHREGHSDSNGEISGAKDSAALKRRQITILRHDPEADSRIILLPHPKVISVERITSMSGRTVAGKEKLRAIVAPCGRRNGHPARPYALLPTPQPGPQSQQPASVPPPHGRPVQRLGAPLPLPWQP